jgi:hypothetical protein
MKTKALYYFLVIPVLFFAEEGLAAKTYICEQPDGSRSFQGTPCDSKTLKIEERKKYESGSEQINRQSSVSNDESRQKTTAKSKDVIKITPVQLLGKWTDATGKGSELVRSVWEFTQNTLKTTRATGISHTHKYKLEGNVLVIQHPADPILKQKAWVQKIEIEDFNGKKLTLGEGRLAASKYLFKL